MNKWSKIFASQTKSEETFLEIVQEMIKNSSWHYGVETASMKLRAIMPLEVKDVAEFAKIHGLEEEVLSDCLSESGTRLLMDYSAGTMVVGDTADITLRNAARIDGSSLSAMNEQDYAKVLNLCFSYGKSQRLLLKRYGVLAAAHSDENGGYEIMDMFELVTETKKALNRNFSEVKFVSGQNAVNYTSAIWEMPGEDMFSNYKTLDLSNVVNSCKLVPAIRFSSSDTSESSAIIQPIFRLETDKTYFYLGEPIKVEHKRKSGLTGIERYKEEISSLYQKMRENEEALNKLLISEVWNPVNVYVGFCKKEKISKKYAESGRETLEIIAQSRASVSCFDVYMCLMQCIEKAKESKLSTFALWSLEEKIAKFTKAEINELDVGGTVSW